MRKCTNSNSIKQSGRFVSPKGSWELSMIVAFEKRQNNAGVKAEKWMKRLKTT